MSAHTPCPHGQITASFIVKDHEWSLLDSEGHSIDVTIAVKRANLVPALMQALRSVAPNWDKPTGFCWCHRPGFDEDDEPTDDHEIDCARARKLLGEPGVQQ